MNTYLFFVSSLYRYWTSYIEGKVTELLQAETRVEQAQKVNWVYILVHSIYAYDCII